MGLPGTGTLIAKAIAGEAGVFGFLGQTLLKCLLV